MTVDIQFREGEHVLKFSKGETDGRGNLYRRDLPDGMASWSTRYAKPEEMGALNFVCPCGCKRVHSLEVVRNAAEKQERQWIWDGNVDRPTLSPSINSTVERGGCGWHGWLTAGVFRAA